MSTERPSVQAIMANALPNPNYPTTAKVGDASGGQEHTRPGIPFYGLARYHQHLPPDAPENASALDWLTNVRSSAASGEGDAAAAAAPASPSKGGKGGKAAAGGGSGK